MRKRGLWTGLILCLLTVCMLTGTALASSGTGSGTTTPDPPTNGQVGALTWNLDKTTGEITITGKGSLPPETAPEGHPWHAYRSQIKSVKITSGVDNIGNFAFSGCSNLSKLVIPDTVTAIGVSAFSDCPKLRGKIELPGSLKTIGNYAFANCSGLSEVTFPYGITSIGESAFSGCTSLGRVRLPNGVTSIMDSAFAGCTSLNIVEIPTTTTNIGAYAFQKTNLSDVFVPKSVTTIGQGAFDGCASLSTIHYGGLRTAWESYNGNDSLNLHYTRTLSDVSHDYCDRNNTREIKVQCNDTECKKEFTQSELIAKAPHSWVKVDAVPSTCETPGTAEGERCSKCGLESGFDSIPAKGHTYSTTAEDLIIREATCETAGEKQLINRCTNTNPDGSICDKYRLVPGSSPSIKIDVKGHKEVAMEEKAATCTEPGSSGGKKCSVCGKMLEKPTTIPALEHNLQVEVAAVEATCTTDGKTEQVKCLNSGCTTEFPKSEVIPKLGHEKPTNPLDIYTEVTDEPECEKDGNRLTIYECGRCGRVEENTPIPALGHKAVRVDPVAATCTKPGKTGGTKCSVCEKVLSGVVETKIDKNAHSYKEVEVPDDAHPSKEPTCTEAGSKYVQEKCEWCDKEKPDSEPHEVVIPAKGHTDKEDFTERVETTKEPTCGEEGIESTIHFCTTCDQEYAFATKPIPATGKHKYGEWTIKKQPTETEPGLRIRTCEVCGKLDPEIIPALGALYTVTLDANGGKLPEGTPAVMKANKDGKLTGELPDPDPRTGFTFKGWFTAATGGEKVTADTVFTKDTTIYAQWSGVFSITFEAGEGKLQDGAEKTVQTDADGKLASLPTCTREGYTFDGWYTAAEGGTKVESTSFTNDTTLYAHWTKKSDTPDPGEGFTVKLDANGGTLDGDVKTVTTGKDGKLTAMPKDPTRSGYTFDGWFTEKEKGEQVTTNTVFTADARIYAHWTKKSETPDPGGDDGTTYAVRVDDTDHGKLTASASKAAKGEKVTIYADPDSGYKVSSVQATDGSGAKVTVTKVSDTQYTFTMPANLVNVTGSFVKDSSSSSDDVQDPSSGSWNTGGTWWNTTDTSTAPDPLPVIQSVPQINAYGQAFRDVPQGHWAAGEIAWVAQNGYMNGVGGGSFAPNRTITHQQLWTVLTRLLRYTNVSDANLQAVRQGLLDGGNPNAATTRQQMVTALHRCAFLLGGARQPTMDIKKFPDSARVSGYAREAMGWAVTNGILTGTSDGRLNPEGTVTRAQFAVFLFRFSQRYR